MVGGAWGRRSRSELKRTLFSCPWFFKPRSYRSAPSERETDLVDLTDLREDVADALLRVRVRVSSL